VRPSTCATDAVERLAYCRLENYERRRRLLDLGALAGALLAAGVELSA
jgi:hypothetical protein